MRGRDILLLVATAGLLGIPLAFALKLVPICGVALFIFIIAIIVLLWDHLSKREEGETIFQRIMVIFTRGKKDEGCSTPGGGDDEILEAEVLDDEVGGEGTPAPTEEHMVSVYTTVLHLDEERAKALYGAGYRRLEDLEGTGVETLMKVDGINPTVARKIHAAVEKIFKE